MCDHLDDCEDEDCCDCQYCLDLIKGDELRDMQKDERALNE